jgi:uncharacterized protein YjbI with pentapeptide repeats
LVVFLNWYVAPTKPSAKKDLVLAVAQILAGTALLSGLYFTWRTLQVNREGQITDRFTRAIDQLGKVEDGQKLFEIRVGGIYALERIARESVEDYGPIMEILTAYVRQNAPLPPEAGQERTQDATDEQRAMEGPRGKSETTEPSAPDPDIQAIMTIFRRRKRYYMHEEPEPLDLSQTNLSGANLSEANLAGANLAGATLSGADLSGADLSLTGADLYGANLSGADLTGATLIGANLYRATLYRANLSEATVYGAHLSRANLIEATLSGADVNGDDLSEANLVGADLTGAHLSDADLSGANLNEANLAGADLSRANLSRAYFYGADLTGANLSEVDLSGANFFSLFEGDLTVANLTGADLSGANLSEANLTGAGLSGANLIQEQLDQAEGDENTKLPSFLKPPEHWSRKTDE